MNDRVERSLRTICERMNGEIKDSDGRTRINDKVTCKFGSDRQISIRTEADLATMEHGESRAVIHNPEKVNGNLEGGLEIRSEFRDDGIRDKLELHTR